MSGPTELEVHSADLQQIASILDGAGSTIYGRASDLEATPDAGQSTDEVAKALLALSSAVAGLGQHLGTLADSTTAAAADFSGTDGAVGGAFAPPAGLVAP